MSTASPESTQSRAYRELRGEEEGRVRAVPAAAFRAALRMFIDGPRLDMGKLAEQLEISKATLYRWTGPREQLLSEILYYLGEQALEIGRDAAAGRDGQARIEALVRGYVEAIVEFEPLRRFVRSETPLAFRILTTRGGLVQSAAAAGIAAVVEEEAAKGTIDLRAPTADLAYAMIRIIEGFIYNDAMADIDTDIESAVRIVCLLTD